ncbi:aggregation-promoting factor C-terminal-like domain-containing protein [Actinomadura harenae]|uniref:aggregation-promoting factor C-terminal-like domain-containing protein n=1 Tax=Actinomadura harenae TaxID=2483351 RepID=UPI00267DF2C3|nr:transglycosylase SLT domain-containing protein [Actinomadura harenae]
MSVKPLRRSATIVLAASLTFGVVAEAVPAQASAPTRAASAVTAKVTAQRLTRAQRNRAIAKRMVAKRGWSARQYTCLVRLWNRESHWNQKAGRPSGAYGIPQALPGSKMRSAGKDWRTNPETQIRWGLRYIKGRYGTPCRALGHSGSRGWY